MGYILLWIESLAAALLLVAIAFVRRPKSRLPSWLEVGLFVGMPVIVGLVQAGAAVFITYPNLASGMVVYTVSWLLSLIAGAIWVRWKIKAKSGQELSVQAEPWQIRPLLAGFIAAAVLHLITFWNLDSSIRTKLATLRLESGAMALAAAPPRPRDEDNAALVYEEAFDMLEHMTKDDPRSSEAANKLYENAGKPGLKTNDPALREFLKKRQPALELIRRAAAMPVCYFEHDYVKISVDMPLPEMSHLRECARIAALDAQCLAADGKFKAAFENVAAIRAMARHIGMEPILISGLVSMAINSTGTTTLQSILTAMPSSPGSVPSASDLAVIPIERTFSFQRVLRRCMAGEEAFGLSVFAILGEPDCPELLQVEMLQALGVNPAAGGNLVLSFWRVYLLQEDLSYYRQAMKMLQTIALLDYSEQSAKLKAWDESIQKNRYEHIMTSLVFPALSHTTMLFTRADAENRLTNLALAVAAYRANTKHFPETLESLVPDYIAAIPADPFDGKPMRYVNATTGCTIYSLGENMKDDGGSSSDPQKGNIAFRIGNVPAR